MDPDSGDYHLSDLSPAISGGIDSLQIDSTWYVVPSTDIEGNPRPNPVGTLPDMGAYENENGIEGYNGPVWYVDASSIYPMPMVHPMPISARFNMGSMHPTMEIQC